MAQEVLIVLYCVGWFVVCFLQVVRLHFEVWGRGFAIRGHHLLPFLGPVFLIGPLVKMVREVVQENRRRRAAEDPPPPEPCSAEGAPPSAPFRTCGCPQCIPRKEGVQ